MSAGPCGCLRQEFGSPGSKWRERTMEASHRRGGGDGGSTDKPCALCSCAPQHHSEKTLCCFVMHPILIAHCLDCLESAVLAITAQCSSGQDASWH